MKKNIEENAFMCQGKMTTKNCTRLWIYCTINFQSSYNRYM